jgi:alanyl-tRNA synthetase
MNQFKPIFVGTVDPNTEFGQLKRATNSQKCIRAGGKHNDLDDVGKDVYHHTFFEMLGNWSFGDYFKAETIKWSWSLLVDVYKVDPDRLYATYFEGDDSQGLPCDDEARILWQQYLPDDHIIKGNKEDNFWEMGDTGPCGPCTEIHYDRIGGGRNAAFLVNKDVPEVLEIWNNVFMTFNRLSDGSLEPLPAPSIDTGMGFERITSILQDKMSNYDTDIFTPIFDAIYKLEKEPGSNIPRYGGKVEEADVGNIDMAYRVVADHIRTLGFSITDGATPDKAGRGYVLRRVLRRGIRYGSEILKCKTGFFAKLVDVFVDLMKDAFPELEGKREHVRQIIADEEVSFGRTLGKGCAFMKDQVAKILSTDSKVFPGEDAFFLYDTMGFPYDLTFLMAEESGLVVDEAGYKAAMKKQQEQSGKKKTSVRALTLEGAETTHLAAIGVTPTNSDDKYLISGETAATIKAIWVHPEGQVKGHWVDSADGETDLVGVILDNTSYYAEQGGQIFDTGSISGGGIKIDVVNSQVFGGFVMHIGTVVEGTIKVSDSVKAQVDYDRRAQIKPNHTMTHILNFALRKTMPKIDISQRGSLCDEKALRFDFTCPKAMTPAQLASVEKICQELVSKDVPVHCMVAPLEQARKISSLRAVFGETYPDPVRVVSVGQAIEPMLNDPENAAWMEFSVEFCGGTHMENVGQAANFLITNESAVSKGERRIEAVTGAGAVVCIERANAFKAKLDAAEKLGDVELVAEVSRLTPELNGLVISTVTKSVMRGQLEKLVVRVKAHKKKIAKANEKAANGVVLEEAKKAKAAGNEYIVIQLGFGIGKKGRDLAKIVSEEFPDASVCLFGVDDDKDAVSVVVRASKKHQEAGFSAKAWSEAALAPLGGKGGGKPDYAMGSAKGLGELAAALAAAKAFGK